MASQKLRHEQKWLTALMMVVMAKNNCLNMAKNALDHKDILRESAQTALYGRVTANQIVEADLAACV